MKKYKYQTLKKEEKKQVKNEFYNTQDGIEVKKRLTRLLIYGILLILFAIWLIIEAYLKKDSIAEYIYGGILIIFAFVFLIARHQVLLKELNAYYLNNKFKNKKRK